MKSVLHSKTIQSLGGWLGVLTFGYAVLTKLTPSWFGKLTWAESILVGITAALATALIGAIAFYIAARGYRLLRPAAQVSEDPRPVGDTVSAHGTVTEVSAADQLARGQYVGRIEITVDRLRTDHAVEIAIFGFNGTDKVVSFSRAVGNISLSLSGSPDDATRFLLSPPSILVQRSNPENFTDYTEYLLVFEQSLKPDVVEWLADQLPQHRVLFDFDALEVVMEVRGEAISVRLPIWNGATVHYDEGYRTHRLSKLQVNSVVTGTPSIE